MEEHQRLQNIKMEILEDQEEELPIVFLKVLQQLVLVIHHQQVHLKEIMVVLV